MSQIDTLDERILAELQANGRLTMKALAERVGLSSPAMIERVRRLEERGVMTGYRAIVVPAALGRPITAIVSARVEPGQYEAFLARVRNEPAVAECHRTTGALTHLLKVHVADTAALEQLVDDLGVTGARCDVSLVLSSPIPWREVTPPEGMAGQRTRQARRRRRTPGVRTAPPVAELPVAEVAEAPKPTRRPGRPKGSRKAATS